MTKPPALQLHLHTEYDVVSARQRARELASVLGFDIQDQARIAAAVSEMARNAFVHARGGDVELTVALEPQPAFIIRVNDTGPGIRDLDAAILDGIPASKAGASLGIVGARRLMDVFDIQSEVGKGTSVVLGKHFAKRVPAPSPEGLVQIFAELDERQPTHPIDELQQQNQELLRTLDELRQQKAELAQVNKELEETNRGVVALYAELDERADYLQRANEIQSRFLSNMTHEFRTPLNSIMGLARILIDRMDGELTPEQEKQVLFIQQSAELLSELVDDLLDLAKVEAGKFEIRPTQFHIADLFGTLRGMLRPLLARNTSIGLIFEDLDDLPPMYTDESKVSQILRNFISNALKYTQQGEVRISARMGVGHTIIFSVQDTGIGIEPGDQVRIFEEFVQLDSPLQRHVKGTGLGLPLSRKLAGLLGGSVGVMSQPGVGSTFNAIIPCNFDDAKGMPRGPQVSRIIDPMRVPVLVVEDNRESLLIYEKYLRNTKFQMLPARTLKEASALLQVVRPVALILDILLESENSWSFLYDLKNDESTKDLPVLVVTVVENEKRARVMGAEGFHAKPVDSAWLISQLGELTCSHPQEKILLIDDDEVARYLQRGLLASTRFAVIEATSGAQGLRVAREEHPCAIFLDLMMPGMDGFATLEGLKRDPATRDVPVFIYSAKPLSEAERARLAPAAALLSKDTPSREAALEAMREALRQTGLG